MALTKSNSYQVHYYPDHIRQEAFKDRSIEIRVVVNETLSGVGDEFIKRMNKKEDDLNKIAENNLDFWEATEVKPVDIKTSKIVDNTKKITNGSIIYSIVLPLPNNFTDRGSHVWDPSIGALNDFAAKTIDTGLGKLGSNVNAVVSKTGDKGGSWAKAISGAAGDLLGSLTKKSGSVLAEAGSSLGFRQPTLDQGYWQNYQRTLPRVFDFEFDLVPNNASEAEMIQNIILNLKRFTMPRSTITGISLLSPYSFEILFGNEKIQRLVNMSNVVCTTMDVNYSGDGNMVMFANGMPAYTRLILGFQEANVITSEFYT